MTQVAEVPFKNYTGNGTQTDFSFPFTVADKLYVLVSLRDASSNMVTILGNGGQPYDYQVIGTFDTVRQIYPGVTVRFNAAPPAGYRIGIRRSTLQEQALDLVRGGGFPAESVERRFDLLVEMIQDLQEQLNRAVVKDPAGLLVGSFVLEPGGSVTGGDIPDILPKPPVPNWLIGWNGAGTALENKDPASFASTVIVVATLRYEAFTGDGSTTNFTLQAAPGLLANIDVYYQGVHQENGVDFGITGTTLTFSEAPANGERIFVRYGVGLAATPTVPTWVVNLPANLGSPFQFLQVNSAGLGTNWADGAYDFGPFVTGIPLGGQELERWPTTRAFQFPANGAGCLARSRVAAAASAVFSLRKNGVQFGTVTFAAAATTGTFSTFAATDFAVGDIFTLVAPTTPDSTIADIGFVFKCKRTGN